MHAASADHLMAVSDEGIAHMAANSVVPIALPGTTVFLGKTDSFAPVRKMVAAGCRVAVATDFNPGSSVYQSMPAMMQLCMARGGLTLEEAWLAATHHPALSLGLQGRAGLVTSNLRRTLT